MTNHREQALEWFRERTKNVPMSGAKKMYAEAVKALEQPEIIRCKDCKHRDDDDFCTGRGCPCQLVPDDGFCHLGKRREERQ